ncbi:MAG: terminase small subunit [Planctomycetota bacterium]|jgi:phage terminase small subunit
MAKNGLCPRQARFVKEYLVDLSATQAAIRAGYSPKTAGQQGYRLLKKVQIAALIVKEHEKAAKCVELTQEWVLRGLMENYQRAMRAIPVFDKQGEPTGEFRYEGNVANRALELLGKHLGMFKEGAAVEINNYVVEVPAREVDAEAWRQRFAVSPN